MSIPWNKEVKTPSNGVLERYIKTFGPWNKGKSFPQVSGKRNHFFKHGFTRSPFHVVWKHMRGRCLNVNNKSYKDYGGRGIKTCSRWNSFLNFKNDLHESYLEHIRKYGKNETFLDRIDVNGDYEPANCQWATRLEQNRNRRDSLFITFNGQTKHIAEWVKITGLKKLTIYMRIKKGWSVEDALTKPLMKNQFG